MTLTSPLLNITVDAAGGLNTCPTNPFGVTGKNCTDIAVNGEPARVSDSSYLQDAQVGDLIRIPVSSTYEYLRVLVKTDSQHLTVQRGYLAPSYPAASHSGTALTMYCGAMNSNGMRESAWDYRDDPYGANAAWSTILADPYTTGGHRGIGGGVYVNAALTWYRGDPSACPKGILSTYGTCEQVRRGTLASSFSAPTLGVADDPPFGGILGFGNPNYVDSHPGPCFSQWCLNARPMDGGSSDGAAAMLGSAASPWVNVSGQLWKHAGAANSLSPKTLTTMAYVGRSPLVDFSGPVSSIATDATGAYRYCIALKAGECRPDSITGDVYVNAPFVSTPYCYYPGVANQGDDTHSICIGPLGAYTGNLVQFGNTQQDSIGMMTRRLGPAFARWNQYGVYWNTSATTNGQLAFSQVRWLDGVRHEDILTVLPSFPSSDSVSRNTFVPISISVPPPNGGGGNGVPSPGGSGSNAVVEFGYGENGSAGSFFCTSRQEACVATSSTMNQASPFYYEQSETYSGVSCASGCTVVVPALSQRVLYYRWKRLGGFGVLGAFSDTRAIVTP
jgi:hypothetical protein